MMIVELIIVFIINNLECILCVVVGRYFCYLGVIFAYLCFLSQCFSFTDGCVFVFVNVNVCIVVIVFCI